MSVLIKIHTGIRTNATDTKGPTRTTDSAYYRLVHKSHISDKYNVSDSRDIKYMSGRRG